MQKERGSFGLHTLALGILCSVFFDWLKSGTPGGLSVRSFLLWGIPGAGLLLLCTAAVLLAEERAELVTGKTMPSRAVLCLLALWLSCELVRTITQAQTVCREQLATGALLGVLPLLVLFTWNSSGQTFAHAAQAVWWGIVIGAVICAAGLVGQFEWQRLSFAAAEGAMPRLPLFPEYFALPLLLEHRESRRGIWLPWWVFGAQFFLALSVELLFGIGSGYSGAEVLRAWDGGIFSRLDALLMLCWLAAAMVRICFLISAIRRCAARIKGRGSAQ